MLTKAAFIWSKHSNIVNIITIKNNFFVLLYFIV